MRLRVLNRLPVTAAGADAATAATVAARAKRFANFRNPRKSMVELLNRQRQMLANVRNLDDGNPRNPDDQNQNGGRRDAMLELLNRQRQMLANLRNQDARRGQFLANLNIRLNRLNRRIPCNLHNNHQNREQPADPNPPEENQRDCSGRGSDFFANLFENPNFLQRCKINPGDLEDAILNAFKNLPDFYSENALIQIQERIMNAVFNPSINNLVTLNINSR